jgi:hypothetical protein
MSVVRWRCAALTLLALWCLAPARAAAADAAEEFAKGTVLFSLMVGGGVQNNIEGHGRTTDITFVNVVPRLTFVPFEPVGSGWYKGAFEVGPEVWFQVFLDPPTTAEGLKAAFRYNFLGLGRLVPYVELLAGAGYKNFRPFEVRSNFTFVLEGGAGLSYFVAPGVALTGGYRFQHVSNGGTTLPNRGFNSDTGVLGISFSFH